MNISILDTKTTTALQTEMAEALQAIAAKYGIRIAANGGAIKAADSATLSFSVRLTSDESVRAAFVAGCAIYDCKPEDFGRVATINGVEVRLVGFEFSRAKFPVRCQEVKGGKFKLYTRDVLNKYFHTGVRTAPALSLQSV